MAAPPQDLLDRFRINALVVSPAGARPKPDATTAPLPIESDGAARLDPARLIVRPERPPAPAPRRRAPFGVLGSLAVHLSPLLLLLNWNGAPAEIAVPIPVQLVLEEPPPAPPPPVATPEREPPRRRLASKDMGAPEAKPNPVAAETTETPTDEPQAETQMAAVLPAPKPAPPPRLVSALPAPVPPPEPPMVSQEPNAEPPAKQSAKRVAARPAPKPRRPAQALGPDADQDEYLAYCEMLIQRYHGMLPLSFLAGRRGKTTLTIMVLGDGTIARVAITRSSGYPDIDSRIQQMVVAVRQFPPVPPRFERPVTTLRLDRSFP